MFQNPLKQPDRPVSFLLVSQGSAYPSEAPEASIPGGDGERKKERTWRGVHVEKLSFPPERIEHISVRNHFRLQSMSFRVLTTLFGSLPRWEVWNGCWLVWASGIGDQRVWDGLSSVVT